MLFYMYIPTKWVCYSIYIYLVNEYVILYICIYMYSADKYSVCYSTKWVCYSIYIYLLSDSTMYIPTKWVVILYVYTY